MRALALLALGGCLQLLPPPRLPGVRAGVQLAPAADCAALNRRVSGLAGAAAAAGPIGGAAGGLAPYLSPPSAQYGVAGAGAGLSAFAAIASYLATRYAAEYARRCTVNVGGAP